MKKLHNASFVADSFENKDKYIPEPLTDDQLKRIYPNSTKANRIEITLNNATINSAILLA